MPDTQLCPKCRSPISANAPGAACPRCLMGLAVEAGASTQAGSAGPFKPPSVEALNDRLADADLEAINLVGCGGMGAVYRARQKRLDRIVALKVLPPSRTRDVSFAERFLREARALAKLNHPHIVAVYDAGQVGRLGEPPEFLYIVMEFVDGASLREVMHAGRLSPREAMRLAPQLCDAMQYAHDRGVVHRDLKPENILLDVEGRARIADFGLAKVSRPSDQPPASFSLTDVDTRMGTPRYMAPEQMNAGADVDHRADIYSLGVLLYEMLTGELPAAADYTPPSRRAEVDGRIDQVVERSLKSSPADRYQQASQVKRDVERITSDAPGRWTAPARWVAVAAVAVVIAVPLVRSRMRPAQSAPAALGPTMQTPFAGAPPAVTSIDGNWALEFDGSTCFVSIPSLKRDYPWPITVEAWVDAPKPARPTVVFSVGGAADCGLSASDENWYVTDPGLQGRFVEKTYGAGPTHFAYVADAKEGRLYLNGHEVDRKPMHDMRPVDDSSPLHAWMGASEAPPGSGRIHYHFRGKIDEVRVSKVVRYDKPFTPARRFEPDADTVALYHCDEGRGDTLSDASGHGHTGRITGARWTAAAPSR